MLTIAATFALIGGLYALLATPIYKADMLIQIEDSGSSLGKNLLGDISSLFETKTATSAEIEILRSRTLFSYVVDNLHLDYGVKPNYFPVFGAWLAKQRDVLCDSGRPLGGYAWGGEKIEVGMYKVPTSAEGKQFILVAEDATHYRLKSSAIGLDVTGQVGRAETWETPMGVFELQVRTLVARPGTEFKLMHYSHQRAVSDLQRRVQISEKGKLSGIVSIELEGANPGLISGVLNTLGSQYVQQNIERKSAEAQKSLDFLAQVLPDAKRNMEQAEERFVTMRNARGTVDLAEEAKIVLKQSAELRTKESMLKIRRDELLKDFTPEHPAIEAIDAQLASIRGETGKIEHLIKKMPNVEREVIGLTRDVKMNTAPGIGKSFSSVNFAGVMAAAGKRVLLIDLDLRKGHLNQYFGQSRDNGFVDLISGEREFDEVVRKNVIPNLDFISTGKLPANPNDILLNSKLPAVLEKCSAGYDVVILDTPPILAVTDPSVLAPKAGTMILAVREGKTSLAEIHESIKRLSHVGATVTGVLMNGVRARPSQYYGYGSYRYSSYAYDSYRPKLGQADKE